VHELVIVNTDLINARFNYEILATTLFTYIHDTDNGTAIVIWKFKRCSCKTARDRTPETLMYFL